MRDDYEKLKETAWRRALRPEEEAALRQSLEANPEAQKRLREEAALTRLMEGISAPRVSSNFTARTLLAARTAPPLRTWRDWFALSQWWPETAPARLAMCSVIVCLGVFSFRETESAHRARVTRELVTVSRAAALPPIEWLKDFDTINKISQVKVADDELLTALQ